MAFNVEITGRSDYYDKIKMAIVGHAGAGKTLFSSTAPLPLFIFFRDQPRIMSIANRAMPHIKVLPELDESGKMVKPVEDIMLEIKDYLEGDGAGLYETVVIDTGDELQKALKEGKKARNRGKWGIADWGWLGDEYTAIVNAFIDLPKNIIVTYHLKNTQEGEDGSIFKEIALQGAAKDDAPGWFDIVGVLDSYEQVDEKGHKTSVRGFATRPTNRYSWIKDHSGQLPPVFDLSENFVGDWDRLHGLIYGKTSGATTKVEHEVISVVTPEPKVDVVEDHPGIPTPEEVDAKKQEKSAVVEKGTAEPEPPHHIEAQAMQQLEEQLGAVEVTSEDTGSGPADVGDGTSEGTDGPRETPDGEGSSGVSEDGEGTEPSRTEPLALEGDGVVEDDGESSDGSVEVPEVSSDESDSVEDEDEDPYKHARCEVCEMIVVTAQYDNDGEPVLDDQGQPVYVVDQTLIDLGKVKYRAVLCKEHLLERRKNG